MINQILYKPFSLYPQAAGSVFSIIENLVKVRAGPVEDAKRSGLPVKKIKNTAVVSTRGVIIKEAGWLADWGFSGLRETSEALWSAASDQDIDSIIWLIDSPGGSVDGLAEFAEVVDKVKSIKPIYAQVDGMMASAALYMAAGATAIYANRRDLVGSIGTRMQFFDYSEYAKQAGIKSITIDTGEYKSAGAFGSEITESHIAEFQRIVDGYFDDFRAQVINNRPLSPDDFEQLADGRVFFSDEEPIKYGLIDGLQSVQQSINSIASSEILRRRASASARLRMLNI